MMCWAGFHDRYSDHAIAVEKEDQLRQNGFSMDGDALVIDGTWSDGNPSRC